MNKIIIVNLSREGREIKRIEEYDDLEHSFEIIKSVIEEESKIDKDLKLSSVFYYDKNEDGIVC